MVPPLHRKSEQTHDTFLRKWPTSIRPLLPQHTCQQCFLVILNMSTFHQHLLPKSPYWCSSRKHSGLFWQFYTLCFFFLCFNPVTKLGKEGCRRINLPSKNLYGQPQTTEILLHKIALKEMFSQCGLNFASVSVVLVLWKRAFNWILISPHKTLDVWSYNSIPSNHHWKVTTHTYAFVASLTSVTKNKKKEAIKIHIPESGMKLAHKVLLHNGCGPLNYGDPNDACKCRRSH